MPGGEEEALPENTKIHSGRSVEGNPLRISVGGSMNPGQLRTTEAESLWGGSTSSRRTQSKCDPAPTEVKVKAKGFFRKSRKGRMRHTKVAFQSPANDVAAPP